MTELLIALALFIGVVWLIARTALLLLRIDAPDDVPSRHYDPITSYVLDNYGQHFVDPSGPLEEQLRKL